MAVTIRFVIRANPQNILCVLVPNLALMTWRKVLAPGALIFSWTETIENSSIWTEAPAAYQNGPLIPYWKKINQLLTSVAWCNFEMWTSLSYKWIFYRITLRISVPAFLKKILTFLLLLFNVYYSTKNHWTLRFNKNSRLKSIFPLKAFKMVFILMINTLLCKCFMH